MYSSLKIGGCVFQAMEGVDRLGKMHQQVGERERLVAKWPRVVGWLGWFRGQLEVRIF